VIHFSTCHVSLVLTVLLTPGVLAAPDPAQAAERPNVLFIAIDDLKPELGCYGRAHIHSPNIDRLAASGFRFERAYCQVAVCGATRTSLLTGLRPDRTGVYDNVLQFRKTVPDVITLPQHFKQQGYHVEGMGKIFHNDDPASWSMPLGWPETPHLTWRRPENVELIRRKREAFARRCAELKARGKRIPPGLERQTTRGPAYEAGDVPDNAYFDGDLCEMALAALKRNAAGEQPFFLAVGFIKPHLPFVAPKRYWDLYDPADIKLADNPFKPRGAPDMAMHTFGELRTYHGIPDSGPVDDALARKLIHGYYASVSYTDALVGRLLDELDRLKLHERTVVILWGDHGWHLGDHGLWGKQTNFESATHAPLIVRVPGTAAGRSSRALVELLDIYPSLCELAGLPLPEHLDGRSFGPLLEDPDRAWKPAALSQYPRGRAMGRSMRTGRYRLTLWQDHRNRAKVHAVELYDHGTDPAENVNLAADPAHAKMVKELRAKFDQQWGQAAPRP
jgi:iduronate 2-sulfatase